MWSFVGNKKNKIWIWLALDLKTREIVGVFMGDRTKASAKKGNHCLLYIGNVLYAIQIFGILIST